MCMLLLLADVQCVTHYLLESLQAGAAYVSGKCERFEHCT